MMWHWSPNKSPQEKCMTPFRSWLTEGLRISLAQQRFEEANDELF